MQLLLELIAEAVKIEACVAYETARYEYRNQSIAYQQIVAESAEAMVWFRREWTFNLVHGFFGSYLEPVKEVSV